MKDFEFANRLCELRLGQGLSQRELAERLGVSNKAVSKWENGDALPSIKLLEGLSEIFNVSIDELIKHKVTNNKQIYKIAITGGPCSGKSTALSWLQSEFTKKGYMVLFVPESASELILGGITPWTIDTNFNFESYIIKLQLEKEKLFLEAANHLDNYDKVLIVCDRGVLDCKAYMTDLEFKKVLSALNTNEVTLRDSYDAVFHLVTAAKGAREFYNNENNKARYETAEEASKKNDATLNAWTGHPHLRVIDNSTDFENKMRRLMSEISCFLGESAPYEIERKFLIEYPNLDMLDKLPNCKKVEIIQTYLKSHDDAEIRIRQRGQNGYFTYSKTVKKKVSPMKRVEFESRISKNDYLKLLLEADTSKCQIRKTIYCLMYNNQYFEIDIYPYWKDKAIIEIELRKENQDIDFPKFVKIVKEVTFDEEYSNYSLASKMGKMPK